jgi:hypothetical protein
VVDIYAGQGVDVSPIGDPADFIYAIERVCIKCGHVIQARVETDGDPVRLGMALDTVHDAPCPRCLANKAAADKHNAG